MQLLNLAETHLNCLNQGAKFLDSSNWKSAQIRASCTSWSASTSVDSHPYQLYDAQREFGEEVRRAPITEEVKEFGETGTHVLPYSEIPETCYFQSQMHFDDSVGKHCRFQCRRWRVQKMLSSPLYAQKASDKPDAMVGRAGEREVSSQYTQSRSKGRFEVSFIRRSESFGATQCIVFICVLCSETLIRRI